MTCTNVAIGLLVVTIGAQAQGVLDSSASGQAVARMLTSLNSTLSSLAVSNGSASDGGTVSAAGPFNANAQVIATLKAARDDNNAAAQAAISANTAVTNGTIYHDAVSSVDTFGSESALCNEEVGRPSSDLVIVNRVDAQQGEVRVVPSGGTYKQTGSIVKVACMKAGEYLNGQLARPILKFPLKQADLGDRTTNEIQRIVLRMYLNENLLMKSPSTVLDVYAAPREAANQSIVASDFENEKYTKLGEWSQITPDAPAFAWYEFDVTASVFDDLVNDAQDESAGSCFRLQLRGDTSLDSSENGLPDYAGILVARFNDNSTSRPPELRIVWRDTITKPSRYPLSARERAE